MYEYIKENGIVYIEISTHIKHNRIRLRVSDQNTYRKNIRVSMNQDTFTLAHTIETKEKQIWTEKKKIGLDKGYRTMLVSSSGNDYGEGLNSFLSEETERLNDINKKRNKYYAMVQTLKEQGDLGKAERIQLNNLGKQKYQKKKRRHDATVKNFINCQLNTLIKTEKPSTIAVENLAFVSQNDRMPKHVKRKLSRWIKGYVDKRLSFKCDISGIKYEYVNPAYTSQECHKCGQLGVRPTQEKFICHTCGTFHADKNAAKTILNRLDEKEINLYTPYKQVKEILQKREAKMMTTSM